MSEEENWRGWPGGLKKLVGLPAPDYSTLSLRLPKLDLDLGYDSWAGEPIMIAVDATRIKVTNWGSECATSATDM